jgi:hypothetical protein
MTAATLLPRILEARERLRTRVRETPCRESGRLSGESGFSATVAANQKHQFPGFENEIDRAKNETAFFTFTMIGMCHIIKFKVLPSSRGFGCLLSAALNTLCSER